VSAQTPPDPPRDPKAELKAAKAYAKASRPWYKKKRFIALGLFGLLIVISVAAGGSNSNKTASSGSGSSSSGSGSPPPPPASSSCTSKATDSCTPDVDSNHSVRVDALTWSVINATTAKTLGDQQFGAGAKADGTFVIVTLKVHSSKNESATMTSEVVKLISSEGNSYSTSTDGTIAAIGSGEDPLFVKDIGPDQTSTSKVVFDVPPRVLNAGMKLRINELGFGSTHGFIALPQTT